jgi:hypothetical protein
MSTKSQLFSDPGDLFVQLYDELGEEPFAEQQVDAWLNNSKVLSVRDRIERDVLATGRADVNDAAAVVDDLGSEGRFALLLGLDAALQHAHPNAALRTGAGMYGILDRYLREARLNTDAVVGTLMFATSFPGRPKGLPSRRTFFGLVRTLPDDGVVRPTWVEGYADIVPQRSAPGDQEILVIGCVPFLDDIEDVDLQRVSRPGREGYRLGPRPSARLRERIDETVRALDDSGAAIGIVPEGCLDDEMLEGWTEALRRSVRSRRRTNLTWLVVGSGPVGGDDPPYNRSVLLHRTGAELGTHEKMFDFTLSPEQIADWQLDHLLGADAPLVEDIRRGSAACIFESSVGRIAILICEDLGRVPETAPRLGAFDVSHVLVPIFSNPCSERSWVTGAAGTYSTTYGAHVVVSNSLVIARLQETRTDSDHSADPITSYAVSPPPDHERHSWNHPIETKSSSSATEVMTYVVPAALIAPRWEDFT